MSRNVLPLFVILALMACKPSQTQLFQHDAAPGLPPDPAPQASDLTADQLLAKYVAARGGEQKVKAIQSVKMAGNWQANIGSPVPITVLISPGHYLRRIADGSDVRMISVVDGPTTWEVIPRNGIDKPTPMSAKDADRFRHQADPQGPLVDPKAKGTKVEVVGKQPWHRTTVYKLKVTFADGGVVHFYLDAQTFLPARVVTSLYVRQLNKSIEMEQIYTDYKDIAGVKWPFTEKANAPEAGFSQAVTWTTVEVNQPVDAAAFKAPKS